MGLFDKHLAYRDAYNAILKPGPIPSTSGSTPSCRRDRKSVV
jgi:hypothetical protein